MAFQSLSRVLGGLEGQYNNQERRHFQQILSCWVEVVGPIVAAQTRPISFKRGVLQVATSSAAWAQNLMFERQRILNKLNAALAIQMTDIRFSPAQWQAYQVPVVSPGEQLQTEFWRDHPSRFKDASLKQKLLPQEPPDALTAFKQWETRMRSRTHALPLCPECCCPTPPGEIERWQVCALCAAKRW